jgi:hypothetical protein
MALGVSVLGSISNAVFASRIGDSAIARGLPAGAHLDSLAAAMQLSAHAGGPLGGSIGATAQAAFMDSFSTAMMVGAAVALIAAPIVLRWMPSTVTNQAPEAPQAELDEARVEPSARLAEFWAANISRHVG